MINLYEIAMDRLQYDQNTGSMTWRANPYAGDWHKARWAGKPAFASLHTTGFLVGKLDGKVYRADRIAWLMRHHEWRTDIYHRNGNKLDNRIINLCAYGLRASNGYPPYFEAEMLSVGYKFA